MNPLITKILYEYMLHELNVKNSVEFNMVDDKLRSLLSEKQYLKLEPTLTELIDQAQKQAFSWAIELLCNNSRI